MSCFDNFIGVRGCSESTPKSGYYIDDLEGINLTSIADIASDSTGQRLLTDKINFAIKQTASDLIGMLPNVDFNSYAENLIGYCFNQSTANGQPSQTINKSVYYAPLGKIQVNRVIIKLDEDATATLEITDGVNVLQSFEVSVTAGIEFSQEMNVISTTNALTARLTTSHDYFIAPKTLFAWRSSLGGCCKRACDSIFVESTEGKGIVIEAAIICDESKLLCRLLHPLKEAILYRSGIELLNEWLASDRVNFLAVHGKEWAAAKIQEWQAIYERKVIDALGNATITALKKTDKVCFDCSGNKFGYSL